MAALTCMLLRLLYCAFACCMSVVPLLLLALLCIAFPLASVASPALAASAPCPANWTIGDYSVRLLTPLPFEESYSLMPDAGEVHITQDTAMPLMHFGVVRTADGAPASWVGEAYTLRVRFNNGMYGDYFDGRFGAGGRASIAPSFGFSADDSYSLISGSLYFNDGTALKEMLLTAVPGAPRVRVLPRDLSIVSFLLCTGFAGGNILSAASPPIVAVAGVPLPPIRLRALTSRMVPIVLGNDSFVASLQTASGASERLSSIVTAAVAGGEVVVSNIIVPSAVGLATIVIDLPDAVKKAPYSVRPFRFPIRSVVRATAVALADLHPASDACWAHDAPSPTPIHLYDYGANAAARAAIVPLPPIIVSAVDGVGGVPPDDGAVGSLQFFSVATGAAVGERLFAPLVGGLAVFDASYDHFGSIAKSLPIVPLQSNVLAGVATVGGQSVVIGRVVVTAAPSSITRIPIARLAWGAENEQFYSSGMPMVATSFVVMPMIRVLGIDAGGARLWASTALLNATCEATDGSLVQPLRGGTAQFRTGDGFWLLDGLVFGQRGVAYGQPLSCRLRVEVRISGAEVYVLRSAFGFIYPTLTPSVALSFARHAQLSFADGRTEATAAGGATASNVGSTVVGLPLPQITFLVRSSDWSVDRSNSQLAVSANATGCGLGRAGRVAVASGGEVQFTSLRAACAGAMRFYFTRRDTTTASLTTAAPQGRLLFTGAIAAAARAAREEAPPTSPVYGLTLTLEGMGGVPLSATAPVAIGAYATLVLLATATGRDGHRLTWQGPQLRVEGSVVVRRPLESAPEAELPSDVVPLECAFAASPNATACAIEIPFPNGNTWNGAVLSARLCVVGSPAVCATAAFVGARSTAAESLRVIEVSAPPPEAPLAALSPANAFSVDVAGPMVAWDDGHNGALFASYYASLLYAGGMNATSPAWAKGAAATRLIPATPVPLGWPRQVFEGRLADPSVATSDGAYALLVEGRGGASGPNAAPDRLHLTPARFVLPPSDPIADGVTVYVLERFRSFSAGRWAARLAAYLLVEPERIGIARVSDCYRIDAAASCTAIELVFRPSTTASVVAKPSAVARQELLAYRHDCAVSEQLRIFHTQPAAQESPPFCDAVALQELVDSARLCENIGGRDSRCDCFVPLAEAVPAACNGALLLGAVCVHLANCRNGLIKSMCDPVRPDMVLQVVQVVCITAAVIAIGLLAANYGFVLEYATTTRQRLRKSRIVGPQQHHDEVFITY